ncbi:MAG: phosphatidylglycerol lysyltransferase domain-containing protein [Rhodobacteraceae bacterium]|nr:phosphatidylglycerol lysyltransferase domain-containing protein [Paracoccaceae bacterium]
MEAAQQTLQQTPQQTSARLARIIPRPILIGGILLICAALLAHRLEGLDISALGAAFRRVSLAQWAFAALASGLSFLAVARYDVVAHRHFATGCTPARATLAGATAVALGQTLGAGVVVGTFVRWCLVPQIGLATAARLSLFVAASFLGALLVTLALVGLCFANAPFPTWINLLIIAGAGLLALTAFLAPDLRIGRHRLTLPSLSALAALLLFCAIDTVMAGLALHTLLPESAALSFATLLPSFLLALGAAILSGTPGGVGPFELTLLALLPHTAETDLLAAILAFRIVYYAVPAILAAIVVLRRPKTGAAPTLACHHPAPPAPSPGLSRAELGVLRQNGGALTPVGTGLCGLVATGQTLVALFDPCGAHTGELAAPLRAMARNQNRIACTYKISARHAAHARRAGWAVLHVANEALIDTARHDLQGPAYRQLRRKLRHATNARLRIEHAADLPLEAMTTVSDAWETTHGTARGLTMGRFEAGYLRHQCVILAWHEGRLVGFISLHRAAHEWCLDLMRTMPDAPDGTMHALVHDAILAARIAGVAPLCLAAVPLAAPNRQSPHAQLRRLIDRASGGAGLRQFKTSFAPRWQRLYMAAPTRPHLLLAACDLARAVRRAPATGEPSPHNQHEEKPIAPRGAS